MLLLSIYLGMGEHENVTKMLKETYNLIHALYGEESELELQLWQVEISLSSQQIFILNQRLQEYH